MNSPLKPHVEPLDQPNRRSLWSTAWTMGFAVVVPLVGLTLLGRWIDAKLGSAPWALLIGLLSGTVLGTSAVAYLSVGAVGTISQAAGPLVDDQDGADDHDHDE